MSSLTVTKPLPAFAGFICLCSLLHNQMTNKLFVVEVNRGSRWEAATYAPRSLDDAIMLRTAMKRDFASYMYRVVSVAPEDYYATIG